MGKMILTVIGVGVGVVLLILAGLAFWNAGSWSQFGRDPAVIGYALIGALLAVAGLGCALATLNHTLRVLDPHRRHAQAHH